MRPLLTLILVLCGLQLVIAQQANFRKGSVRLKGGEEREGLIGLVIAGTPEQIEFKEATDATVQVYEAGQIDGYTANSTFYSSYLLKRNSDNWGFVQVVVDGELSLLIRNGMTFLRLRDSDDFVYLDHGYRKALASVMKGCPFVASRVAVTSSKKNLEENVKAYNECVSVKNPNFDGIPNAFSVGLMAGYDYTGISFGSTINDNTRFLSADKQRDKAFVQFGVDLLIKPHKLSNHIGVYSGLFYNSNKYATTNSEKNGQRLEVNTYSINYSELRIPLGAEFSRPWRKRVTTFFRGGIVIPVMVKLSASHSRSESISTSNGAVYTQTPGSLTSFKMNLMYGATAGMDFHLEGTKKIRLQVGGNLGRVKAIVTTPFDDSEIIGKVTSLNFMAGYVF